MVYVVRNNRLRNSIMIDGVIVASQSEKTFDNLTEATVDKISKLEGIIVYPKKSNNVNTNIIKSTKINRRKKSVD